MSVVKSHPLEGDTYEIWMDRIKGFAHIPCADTAASTTLLNLLLKVD
jgi:hypothetical protein